MTHSSEPDFRLAFESAPGLYLLLLPNAPVFTIVGASDAYLTAVKKNREEVLGRALFEVFPDNPDDPEATGVTNLRASLLQVLAKRATHAMPVQKYDIQRPEVEGRGFEERYWSPANSPVFNKDGEVQYILHRVEDVTELLESKRLETEQNRFSDSLRLQAGQMKAELVLRDRLLEEARNVIAERESAEAAQAEKIGFTALGAEIGMALSSPKQLPEVLQRCAEAVACYLQAAFARIWILNEATNVLELQASAGLYTHLDGEHSRVPLGSFEIGRIAQERQPYLSNDVQNDPLIHDREWARREGIVAFAGYPLVGADRVVGVLAMFARHPLRYEAFAMLSVVEGIAIGIERKWAEEALVHQTEVLAQSNANLQQFAYVTSHDLQEPLRAMITASQMLARRYAGQLDPEGARILGYVVNGAKRMRALIDSILVYSKVMNADSAPSEPVQLKEAVHAAMMNLQVVIEENAASIKQDPLPAVRGDQVQLAQLFQNLIGNAIKYRKPDQPPCISISAVQTEKEWVIDVSDNGIGLDPKYAEQIFGVFKRLHGREIPGTGIGLSVCQKIVERHGGRIWVQSEPGKGATFYFTLPAALG